MALLQPPKEMPRLDKIICGSLAQLQMHALCETACKDFWQMIF